MDLKKIRETALAEIEHETFRAAVEEYKRKLKEQSLWDKIFPWRIVFIKKEKL